MTQEIRKLFNSRLRGAAATSFLGEVQKVDKESCTCVVAVEEICYDDVLIRSVSDGSAKGAVLFPKVGSKVMATRIGGSNELYVSMFSEVDEVAMAVGDKTSLTVNESGVVCSVGEIKLEVAESGVVCKADKTTLEVAKAGISLAKEDKNLKSALEALIDAIALITVPCAAPGSSSGPPANAAQIKAIKGQLDFLK